MRTVRIMGLDVGDLRIGVAVSDATGQMAQPLGAVDRGPRDREIEKLKELIREHDVGEIVVGFPLTLEGEVGPQARKVAEYARILKKELEVPVKLWDERLSTMMVEKAMVSAGVKRRKRKRAVDKLAAAVILQGYLDARRAAKAGA